MPLLGKLSVEAFHVSRHYAVFACDIITLPRYQQGAQPRFSAYLDTTPGINNSSLTKPPALRLLQLLSNTGENISLFPFFQAIMASYNFSFLLVIALVLAISAPVSAFGAGNIASLSKIEGHNWRHGDIEDMLKTVAFLKGHKWTSMMIKRVYFGNWLRDYSQAVDVGTLKGVQAGTIRILVWVLAFMSFGYATNEFEVNDERLGTYRPEEHIDNPKDYADNEVCHRHIFL